MASGTPDKAIATDIPFAGTLLKKETDYAYFTNNLMKKKQASKSPDN
jgi:hypothetical protein